MHSDTDELTQQLYDDLLRRMSPEEKFMRMAALSDAARAATWAGAERYAGHQGRAAVVERFFLQMYGADVPVPEEIRARFRALDDE